MGKVKRRVTRKRTLKLRRTTAIYFARVDSLVELNPLADALEVRVAAAAVEVVVSDTFLLWDTGV